MNILKGWGYALLVATGPAAKEAWRYVADLWLSGEIHDRFHMACQAAGVTPPQLKTLLSLEPGVSKAMRSIADGLKCDASWVTGIVDGLESQGYAERKTHPVDRRIKIVVITPLGEKAKAQALKCLHEPPASFSTLNLTEQRQLRDLLAKIMSNSRPATPA